jgi:hypothetical protein
MSIGGDSAEVILTVVNVQIFTVKAHIRLPNGGKSRVVQLQNVKLEDTSDKHFQLWSLWAATTSDLMILTYGWHCNSTEQTLFGKLFPS